MMTGKSYQIENAAGSKPNKIADKAGAICCQSSHFQMLVWVHPECKGVGGFWARYDCRISPSPLEENQRKKAAQSPASFFMTSEKPKLTFHSFSVWKQNLVKCDHADADTVIWRRFRSTTREFLGKKICPGIDPVL